MRVKVVLNEGSRPNEIGYHFTDLKGLQAILDSNFMKATNEPLEERTETRFKITFPDGSHLNVDEQDGRHLKHFLYSLDDYYLTQITNNRLKEKVQQFTIESGKEIQIEEYEYTPYKDLIGKTSWSYTRRPEGMSYRNFKTFGENTVRIKIDIDKLTEKGYKIVPFSWTGQPKSGSYNEYEERVFGRGEKEAGTSNFLDFVTEIAFTADNEYDLYIARDKLEVVFSLKQMKQKFKNMLNISYTPEEIRQCKHNELSFISNEITSTIDAIKNQRLKKPEDFYLILDKLKDIKKKIVKAKSNIAIVYANPETGNVILSQTDAYQRDQCNKFLTAIKSFYETGTWDENSVRFNQTVLQDKMCKKEFFKLLSTALNIVSKTEDYQKFATDFKDRHEKYDEEFTKTYQVHYDRTVNELKKLFTLLPKKRQYQIIVFKNRPAIFFFDNFPVDFQKFEEKHSSKLSTIYLGQSPKDSAEFLCSCICSSYRIDILNDPDESAYTLSDMIEDCPEGVSSFYILTPDNIYEVGTKMNNNELTFPFVNHNGKLSKTIKSFV